MSAVVGDLPPEDGSWAFEPKWDGMRIVASVSEDEVVLHGRSGRDVTVEFPELQSLREIAADVVLDGEVVAMDDDGRPSFAALQQRFGVTDPAVARRRATSVPVTYVVFDLLLLDGVAAWRLPYADRRELLERLVSPGPRWFLTSSARGDGRHWLDAARAHSLEGVVAKRVDRPYEPGRRSSAWRKIKVRHQQEFAVCGWLPGTGRRGGGLGSLVLGCRRGGLWAWVGNAGTGLTQRDLDWWHAALEAVAVDRSPFETDVRSPALRAARWVRPTHAVQVSFAEWTSDGRLRQPSILGRRDDVDVEHISCVDEVTGDT
jgi:bifunctional non-homologous end joining protein LigD